MTRRAALAVLAAPMAGYADGFAATGFSRGPDGRWQLTGSSVASSNGAAPELSLADITDLLNGESRGRRVLVISEDTTAVVALALVPAGFTEAEAIRLQKRSSWGHGYMVQKRLPAVATLDTTAQVDVWVDGLIESIG